MTGCLGCSTTAKLELATSLAGVCVDGCIQQKGMVKAQKKGDY